MLDDFLTGFAEDVDVVIAYQVVDLHVGSVHGSQGNGSVQHELHVSGSAGLFGCQGDLLGDIAGRDQFLSLGYVVVLDHNHMEELAGNGIFVDDILQAEDGMNDILCDDVSGSGLCTENSGDGAFRKLAGFDLQIFVDQVEHVQLLTFVLVQTFNLDIVDGVVVDLDALSGQDVVFQDFLVGLFDLQKLA